MNNYGKQASVLRGDIEDIVLPVEEVDIIIAPWYGQFLIQNSLIDTVIYARDHYLATSGRVTHPFCSNSRYFLKRGSSISL